MEVKEMTVEMKKEMIKANGWIGLVNELRSIGYNLEEALEQVIDMKTMSKEEFAAKYLR